MKTTYKSIITRNVNLFRRITPYVSPQDSVDDVVSRVKREGMLHISEPDHVTEALQITFTLKAAMAATKGANFNEIVNLLKTATNGAITAIGTSLTGHMAAANGVGGTAVNTLKHIMAERGQPGNETLGVPLSDIQIGSNGKSTLKMTALANGWTKTNDWDEDEIAYFSHQSRIGSAHGNHVEQWNKGTEKSLAFSNELSKVEVDVTSGMVDADLDIDWKLKTDGAFSHDTVSLVQIDNIVITVEYVSTP